MAERFPPLRENGFRDTWCGQVLEDRIGSESRVAGWVHRRRDHGGLIFIDLRDRTGLVQLVFNPQAAGGAHELAHADTPPFEIESFSGEVGEELRLRYRYLDLRRDGMRSAIELRHRVARSI